MKAPKTLVDKIYYTAHDRQEIEQILNDWIARNIDLKPTPTRLTVRLFCLCSVLLNLAFAEIILNR